jgi:hypothetical protein
MSKRTLVSLAALGLFTVLAFGSNKSALDQDDMDEIFEKFEQELDANVDDAGDEPAAVEEPPAEEPGADAGGGDLADNVAACRYYVDRYNGLECLKAAGVQLNADDMCPAALNQSPLDMRAYYKCMADASKCDGPIPDLSGVTDCKMPSF